MRVVYCCGLLFVVCHLRVCVVCWSLRIVCWLLYGVCHCLFGAWCLIMLLVCVVCLFVFAVRCLLLCMSVRYVRCGACWVASAVCCMLFDFAVVVDVRGVFGDGCCVLAAA